MAQIFCVLSIVILILISILCLGLRWSFYRKEEYTNAMIPNHYLLYTGILCGGLFSFITILSSIQETEWGYGVFFSLFVWLCIFILYGWLGMITVYDENGFTKGWLPGQKRYYRYEELTGFKQNHMKISFLKGRRKISYEYLVIDCFEFEWYVMHQYKLKTGRELKEDTTVPSWDIFNGHVDNPMEFIVIYALVFVAIAGFAIWMLVDANKNVTEEDTIYVESPVSSYTIDEDTIILYLEDTEGKFVIYLYEEYGEIIDEMLEDSKSSQVFCVNALELGNEEDERKYEIYSVSSESGQQYLSFEDVNREDKENTYEIVWLFAGFLVVWAIFCGASIVVGRNPHKFSKRVQGWFFKDGYLH